MTPLSFEEELSLLLKEFRSRLVLIKNMHDLEQFRLHYLSNGGSLYDLTEKFKKLSLEEKRIIGGTLQEAKRTCIELFENKKTDIESHESKLKDYTFFDPSLCKDQKKTTGSFHHYTKITQDIEDIFLSLGFEVIEGKVVEDEYYNFSALNIPEDHPARTSHDTFWLDHPGKLLRTHTSAVQVREAQKRTPPFGLICPGRVYRNEATDASHDFMFWQCEGLYIAQDASIAQLLYVLKRFLQMLFEKDTITIRTRPSYFPFVEPGIEVDMSCPFCKDGCSTCKKTQWIEICGAGMVHPFVLKEMGIDYPTFTGFAFGFGLTRLAMLKYQISDIRSLHHMSSEILKRTL